MVQTVTPLFPVEILEALEARGQYPESSEARPGVMGPIAMTYGSDGSVPIALVELAFFPGNDLPEPLLAESWETWRARSQLPSLDDLSETGIQGGAGYRVELGPTVVVRNPDIGLAMILPAPGAEWEDAVRAAGGAKVVAGTGLGVNGSGGAAAPGSAVATIATYTGTFPAPDLTGIPGLQAIPLTSNHYVEDGPKALF
jgi:hypothetical protein